MKAFSDPHFLYEGRSVTWNNQRDSLSPDQRSDFFLACQPSSLSPTLASGFWWSLKTPLISIGLSSPWRGKLGTITLLPGTTIPGRNVDDKGNMVELPVVSWSAPTPNSSPHILLLTSLLPTWHSHFCYLCFPISQPQISLALIFTSNKTHLKFCIQHQIHWHFKPTLISPLLFHSYTWFHP